MPTYTFTPDEMTALTYAMQQFDENDPSLDDVTRNVLKKVKVGDSFVELTDAERACLRAIVQNTVTMHAEADPKDNVSMNSLQGVSDKLQAQE